ETQHLSELRIVLMGNRNVGKSSTKNTILGREEIDFLTHRCVKRHGEVANRHITVIEAPGWWRNESVEESPELLKQEILLSVSLCPPGPHAVLLIIRADYPFTENNRKVLQGYVDLLCERVWSHTIVLFTRGDSLLDTSIEQHIESEGQDLQWLLDKCGNRYHVLNNQNRSDDTQIKELLEKIEETVAQNNGCHLEIDRKNSEVINRSKGSSRGSFENATDMSDAQHLSELRIVLMGYRAAGKSSTGNTILGREEFDLKTSAQCVRRHGEVADRHITVIEAPGWWIDEPVQESSELLKQEILLSVSLCPPGPHAVLLIIHVDYMFKETERKVLQGYLDLLGERVWSHTIVLFTRGDFLLDTSIEQHIESEGQDLQWLLDKCGNRYHVLNNQNRSDDTQIKELLEKIEETVAQNNGCHLEIDRNNSEVINRSKGSSRGSFENATNMMGDGESPSFSPLTKQKKRSQYTRVFELVRKSCSIGVPPSMSVEGKTVTEIFNRCHTIEPIKTAHSRKVGPSMSGDDGSDSWSLGSSAYGSFRSRSGADTVFGSSRSRDSSHTSYESGAIKRYNSIGLPPPNMSVRGKTVTEKCYRRHTTQFTARYRRKVGLSIKRSQVNSAQLEADSRFGSSCSIVSTGSSGYGSSCSLPQSVEQSEHKWTNSAFKISELSDKQDECEDMNL
ncbi:GTPase IMAP family member 8-like, partial [Sinocyclocheilus anshuiensis]